MDHILTDLSESNPQNTIRTLAPLTLHVLMSDLDGGRFHVLEYSKMVLALPKTLL